MSRGLWLLCYAAALIGAAAGSAIFFRGLRWIHPGLALIVGGLAVSVTCILVAVLLSRSRPRA